MWKELLIVYFIFFQSFFAVEIPAESNLTLRQAILLSLNNNNNYKAATESVEESRLKVRETWGMLWPTLSTDIAYTRMGAETGFNSSIEGQYDIKFINGEIAVNPGIFYHSLKASRDGHIIAVNNRRKIKSDTTIKTISFYYRVMLTRETVTMRRESLESLMENLKTVTAGYEKGILSRLDFLRAKVAVSNARTMLINAENDYLTAISMLNIQLGKDINQSIKLSKSVGLQVRDTSLDGLDTNDGGKLIIEMIGEALKNRPELIQIKKKRDAEVYGAKAGESIYMWPTFFISGNYGQSKTLRKSEDFSTGDPDMDQMFSGIQESFSPSEWNRQWAVTFGATYRWGSLFSIDSSHAKSKQARSKAKQTEYQLKDFIEAVKLEVKRGYLKLKSASNSLEAQKGNIETAEETLKVSNIQFRNGIIDNTRLLEANVQLTTAKTLFIQSLYDYQVAKAELNKAIGKEYFTIE
ncbi:MAG: TolC family protein [Spirochaetota bacterium]|nr:TolC family protein [Spirochaetota bacterium]